MTAVRPDKFKVRTNYLILPAFQLKMILAAIFLSASQCLVLLFLLRHFSENLLLKLHAAEIVDNHPLALFFQSQISQLQTATAITGCVLVLVLVNIVVFLFISHRIAGPLYRVRETAKSWQRGDLKALKLRKGDIFQDVAQELEAFRNQIEMSQKKNES